MSLLNVKLQKTRFPKVHLEILPKQDLWTQGRGEEIKRGYTFFAEGKHSELFIF